MSLSALRVALQGVGFQLTPIALAVQGLIALLEEERRNQVYGSGKKLPVPQDPLLREPRRDDKRKRDDDELLRRQVEEKWEAIEAARRPKPSEPDAPGAAVTPSRPDPAPTPATEAKPVADLVAEAQARAQAQLEARRRADEEALLLILAEL